MQPAPRRCVIHCTVALATAAVLSPRPAAAQPSYTCQVENPPTVMCIDQGQKCFHLTRSCELVYGAGQGGDRTVLFFENRGTSNGLWNGEDRHCYVGEQFAGGGDPDVNDFGLNTFALLLPADWDEQTPFPLYLDLRGALAGWVEEPIGAGANAWSLDTSGAEPEFVEGIYHGHQFFGQGDFNDMNIFGRLIDNGGLRGELRKKDDGAWAFLVPSACSHDGYNGRPELGGDGPGGAFAEAELSRFGYVAIAEDLEFIDEEYGIEYLYSGAVSGGGLGSFMFARDLDESVPFFAEEGRYRGAIMDAAPFEFGVVEDLYDAGETVFVDDDLDCSGPPELDAEVPCQHPAEPLTTDFDENALDYSASEDIANPNVIITVPILHLFNSRGDTFCYNHCLAEGQIHGPIRDEIDARTDVPFSFSETVEGCVGSCLSLDQTPKLLTCTAHSILNEAPYTACAVAWINEINAYWESEGVDAYQRPSLCDGIQPLNVSTNPPPCGDQDINGVDMW